MNKIVVLSVCETTPIPSVIKNHASYALEHGYIHKVIDLSYVALPEYFLIFKWREIYDNLKRFPGYDFLVLSENSIVYSNYKVHDIFDKNTSFFVSLPFYPSLANTAAFFLKGDVATQVFTLNVSLGLRNYNGFRNIASKMDLYAVECDVISKNISLFDSGCTVKDNVFPIKQIQWKEGNTTHYSIWSARSPLKCFIACSGLLIQEGSDGRLYRFGYDHRIIQLLLKDVQSGRTFLSGIFDSTAASFASFNSAPIHLNQSSDIAIVSLYTANIANYGKVHEDSLISYCNKHNIAYHLYRDTPTFVPVNVSKNWSKMHILRHHLSEHEWVFWVDADIVVTNLNSDLRDLITDQTAMFTFDHTGFYINSGVVGLKNTKNNFSALDAMCAELEAVKDQSSVYASGGDQKFICNILRKFGLINQVNVSSSSLVEHSPMRHNSEAIFWHCPSFDDRYRTASMILKLEQDEIKPTTSH